MIYYRGRFIVRIRTELYSGEWKRKLLFCVVLQRMADLFLVEYLVKFGQICEEFELQNLEREITFENL